jgi:hypothetical protein
MLVAIGVENHRPLIELLFKAVGVQLRLPLTDPRVAAGALGFYEAERLPVVTPEHIVDEALSLLVRHPGDPEFRVLPRLIKVPSGFLEQQIDEGIPRRRFVVIMRVSDRRVGLLGLRNLGAQLSNLSLKRRTLCLARKLLLLRLLARSDALRIALLSLLQLL